MTFRLRDYALGTPITDGKTSAWSSFQRAFVAAASFPGEPLIMDPGNYFLDQTLYIPHYLNMVGYGSASRLIHAPGFRGPVLFMHDTIGAQLRNFYVSGGLGDEPPGTPATAYNNHDSYGYVGPEVSFGGTGCLIEDVVIQKWNHIAAICEGTALQMNRCYAQATPRGAYKPDSGSQASLDLGSTFGFLTPEQSYCTGLRMIDCGASGTRGPGIFVGGTDGALIRPSLFAGHLEYCPRNDDPGGFTSGGGMLALSRTWCRWGSAGNQNPERWVIDTPFISASPGPAVTGIELSHAWGVDLRSPMVLDVRTGVVIRDCRHVNMDGGMIGRTSTTGLNIYNSMFVRATSSFESCNTAVTVGGSSSGVDLRGTRYYANYNNVIVMPGTAPVQQ